MTTPVLRVSPALALPVDVVGESTAILAKKGAGKSNTAKVIVEETLDHGGVQVVVLDPIGHWWSLRAGADGKPRGGYPIAVLGGEHGDLPLEETAGKLLAQTVVDSAQSIVLDVSGLETNGAMQRFVYDFLEELYRLKQKTPTPLLLVLEEADEFAPQDPKGTNVPRMVGAANRISKRGRGRGIGMLYVTQRSAALNKNVLDQADTLIVMRTIGPRDRKAIEGWVAQQQAEGIDEVLPSLPSLATGEAWIWSPERALLKRVQIRKARTFDSSYTPRPGETVIVAEPKPIDVDALGEKMRATRERVKENDPAELRQQLREAHRLSNRLEAQLADALTVRESQAVEKVVEVPVPVFNGEVDRLEQVVQELAGAAAQLQSASENVSTAAAAIAAAVAQSKSRPGPARPVVEARHPRVAPAARAPVPTVRAEIDADVKLGKGERTVLDVLAEYPDGRTYNELAFLAGYSAKASTLGVILSNLRKAGLVEPGNQPVRPTAEGLSAAGGARERPSGPALLDQWLRHPRMGEGERRVLLALIDSYPDAPTHEELCELTGYSPSASTMGVILSKLRKLGLVEKGARRAAAEFIEAIR